MNEAQMKRAIKKLDAAYDALTEICYAACDAEYKDPDVVTRDNAVLRIKTDLREFTDYMRKATWWKK